MNIKLVRDVLKRNHEVSLQELSVETGEKKGDLEYILIEWESRGRIRAVGGSPFCSGNCGSCVSGVSCSASTEKRYRWN